jgi:hypothetical protein
MSFADVENIVPLFKNSNGNVQIVLKDGTTVAFLKDPAGGPGRFFTSNAKLMRQLQECVDSDQEFGVFIDSAEPTIDTNAATPMDQMRKKIREELMAELRAGGKIVEPSSYNALDTAKAQAAIGGTNTVVGSEISPEQELVRQSSVPRSEPVIISSGSEGQVIVPATEEGAVIIPPVNPLLDGSGSSLASPTIQPEGAAEDSKLSALEKLKAGNKTS